MARELISASLDGELEDGRRRVLDRHVATCPGCSRWAGRAETLQQRVRVRPAAPVPDLTSAIMKQVPDHRHDAVLALRYALAAVAAILVLVHLPLLFLGEQAGATEHLSRHLGAFSVALAIGLGYAAWRPDRAEGLLPVALTLGLMVTVTGVIDLATGRSNPLAEARHVLELVGVVLLLVMAGPRWSALTWIRSQRRRATPTQWPMLVRAVGMAFRRSGSMGSPVTSSIP